MPKASGCRDGRWADRFPNACPRVHPFEAPRRKGYVRPQTGHLVGVGALMGIRRTSCASSLDAPYGVRTGAAAFGGLFGIILAAGAGAAIAFHVSQRDRAFDLKEITVAVGDIIHFDNEDEFIHQIYIDAPDFSFDSGESYPGDSIDVTFTKRGTYMVRCHIHPKMLLKVTVK
jgi:plastocyanin